MPTRPLRCSGRGCRSSGASPCCGFDDADRLESEVIDEDHVFVSEEISVAAIGALVGIANPFLDPWEPHDGDEELIFRAC